MAKPYTCTSENQWYVAGEIVQSRNERNHGGEKRRTKPAKAALVGIHAHFRQDATEQRAKILLIRMSDVSTPRTDRTTSFLDDDWIFRVLQTFFGHAQSTNE